MKIRRLFIILLLLIVAFGAGLVVGPWLIGGGDVEYTTSKPDVVNTSSVSIHTEKQTSTTTSKGEFGETKPVETKPQSCEENLQSETTLQQTSYQPKTILVAFQSGTTYEYAQKVVAQYNLSINQSEGASGETPIDNWLTVKVPEGQEFQWICTFRARGDVRTATVNTTFDLHQ